MCVRTVTWSFLRVSMPALCSVQLHTWTDAVSNKDGPPLIWCPTQRLLPLSRQYSNSLLDLLLQSSATLHRETLNLGPRQALLNTHSPPGHWGVGWMSPHKSRWPAHIPSLAPQHHTYPPQVTGGLLGIGISAFSCPVISTPTDRGKTSLKICTGFLQISIKLLLWSDFCFSVKVKGVKVKFRLCSGLSWGQIVKKMRTFMR